jgi:xylulokinase
MADFIGIDVGSSFIKAAVIDLDALTLRRTERVPFPGFEGAKPPLHREVDPCAIQGAVDDLLACLLPYASDCAGLALCGQMHGFVLVNRRGEPVSNYISWLDQRVSTAEFDEIAAQVTETERRELGNEFRPSIALSLLYWLSRHGALPPGEVTPVSIADFVAARLCGVPPVMEPTQAAAFGALRVGTLHWHDEVVGKLGLDAIRWPELRPTGSTAGTWRGLPCYTTVGDQQCALAGALLGDGELSVNIGTGSQVATLADSAVSGELQVRPYFDGRFLHTVTHVPGGRALSALVALLTELGGVSEEQAWKQIEPALASVPATDLRAAVSFYPGPCGNVGFLENLHEGNLSCGHVFRAVFESMARNYETCARRLDPARRAQRVVLSGGVARRLPVLRDQTAAALGLPSRLSPHAEDTLFGLMVLALAFSGRRPSVREATEVVSASVAIPANRP